MYEVRIDHKGRTVIRNFTTRHKAQTFVAQLTRLYNVPHHAFSVRTINAPIR